MSSDSIQQQLADLQPTDLAAGIQRTSILQKTKFHNPGDLHHAGLTVIEGNPGTSNMASSLSGSGYGREIRKRILQTALRTAWYT
jgi:hypothetical protein